MRRAKRENEDARTHEPCVKGWCVTALPLPRDRRSAQRRRAGGASVSSVVVRLRRRAFAQFEQVFHHGGQLS